MKNEKAKIFDSLLDTFENDDIRNFAVECIETIPDYFWEVGASSTGKFHPKYALGELGLARHTCALVRILNYDFSIDCYKHRFTSRQRDLLRVAGIMHDSRKSGDDADFKENKYTRDNHPLLAAEEVRSLIGFIPEDELEYIAEAIESHMGQWNTDKEYNEILPLPKTEAQCLLHQADYLASRKDITLSFAKEEKPKPVPKTPDTYIFHFGKYVNKKLSYVLKTDRSYLIWCKENLTKGELPRS